MPVVQHTNLNENTILALWKIDETRESLHSMLSRHFKDGGTNLHDSLHWLASRVLLQQLFVNQNIELHKDEFNKPSLSVNGLPYHVSISHSYEYAVVIVSTKDPVAVDLEKIDDRVVRVAHKFIREDESVPEASAQAFFYTIIWSAKETLYKYYGRKQLDFKRDLRIGTFSLSHAPFTINGYILKEDYLQEFGIHVVTLNGYILTYIV